MTYLSLKAKMMLRSPLVIGLMVLSLLLGILGAFIVNTYESQQTSYAIGIVDMDHTSASNKFIEALEKHPSLSVHLYKDRQSANKALSRKEILQKYVLLKGFQTAISSGQYNHIIEVSSMIKSPFSPWLNDQVSVGVIREWVMSDGYKRLLSIDPNYSRTDFTQRFNAYDAENELLFFTVIESNSTRRVLEEGSLPFYIQALLWGWSGVLLLMSLIFMRQLYIEKQMNISRRLQLSGINPYYYHSVYIGLFMSLSVIGVGIFILGFSVIHTGQSLLLSPLILASLFLSACFYISIWLINKINLNLNQLMLIYLGLIMVWSLLSIESVGIVKIGQFLHDLSPLTLFFKICS